MRIIKASNDLKFDKSILTGMSTRDPNKQLLSLSAVAKVVYARISISRY
jgi:hypothetical protein